MSEAFDFDQDALMAGIELVGRTGAESLEVGYFHDNVPVEEAGWYANAQYQGSRLTVENEPGPVQAVQALAERILTGAKCKHCGRLVSMSDEGAWAWQEATMMDGTTWTAEEAVAAGQCRWVLMGRTWRRGCEVTT